MGGCDCDCDRFCDCRLDRVMIALEVAIVVESVLIVPVIVVEISIV